MLYKIEELLREDGASPFAEWFDSLEAVAAAKVRVAVGRMEQGNLSRRDIDYAVALWDDYKRRKACAWKGD